MPDSAFPPSGNDDRIGEAVAWYFREAESGRPPSRAEFLALYPDLRSELESFLADKAAFDRAAGPASSSATLAHLPFSDEQNLTRTHAGQARSADQSLGTVRYFGDYELLGEIARGGMGVVFKARQVSLNRFVALKMILSGRLASEADVNRFRMEAEAAAHLDHPNIVPIYEVGTHEGNHYYAMQFVDGPSLAGSLSRSRPAPRDSAELVRTCALAVQYAHDRGVIHRDLKPGNILMGAAGKSGGTDVSLPLSSPAACPLPLLPAEAKITDFGLAKRTDSGPSITGTGDVVGTPSYMAPEQASGRKSIGPGTDIYALGAILYELLAGEPPFCAANFIETLVQVRSEPPIPPSRMQRDVPPDLETICLKCLEKRPEDRYPTAAALANDLTRFLHHEPIQARPISRARRFSAWVRKQPWMLVGLSLVAILALSLLAQSFYLDLRATQRETMFREAQVERLQLALQPTLASESTTLRPAAQRAMTLLRASANGHPRGRCSDEALELLLVAGQGGRRIHPEPQTRGTLPADWVSGNRAFPWPFSLTRDGKRLQLPGRVLDLESGRIAKTDPAFDGEWDPTGTLLCRPSAAGLQVIVAGSERQQFVVGSEKETVYSSRFSPDGRLWAAVLGDRNYLPGPWNSAEPVRWSVRTLEVWENSTGRRLSRMTLPNPSRPNRPEFSGDSRLVAWPAEDEVLVFETTNGNLLRKVSAPGVFGLALNRDGSVLAWSRGISGQVQDAKVTLVALPGGEPIRPLHTAGPVAVIRLVFSPDGHYLIGHAGYTKWDAVYSSFGVMDPRLASIYRDQTDRICIWEWADGRLVAEPRGRAFADGFGPHGELAVVRASGPEGNLFPEFDLWRPAELAAVLEREHLSGWVYAAWLESEGEPQSGWAIAIFFTMLLAPLWWSSTTIQQIQKKRLNIHSAYLGFILTAFLVVFGVVFCMKTVALETGHWSEVLRLSSERAFGVLYAALGLIYLLISTLTGGLAIQCYIHVVHGEPVPFFERLQVLYVPDESERKAEALRTRRAFRTISSWMLIFVVLYDGIAYLDNVFLFTVLSNVTNTFSTFFLMALIPLGIFPLSFLSYSAMALGTLSLLLVIGDSFWGPPRKPWFHYPAGFKPTSWSLFVARVYNVFPLRRKLSAIFWTSVLMLSLVIAAYEMYIRLASGQWPYQGKRFGNLYATGLLTLGIFWIVLSGQQLMRIARPPKGGTTKRER